MRALIAVVALLAVAPATARADCRSHPGPNWAHQERLTPLLHRGGAFDMLIEVTGAQYAGHGLDNSDTPGWYIGVAPGPLTVDEVRAEIERRVDAAYGPEDAAYLKDGLKIDPERYSEAELRAIQNAFPERIGAIPFSSWVGCSDDGVRRAVLQVYSRYSDVTEQERVRAIVAEYGDRARLEVSPYDLPQPTGLTPPPSATPSPPTTHGDGRPARLREVLAVRCGRRLSLRVRPRHRAAVRRVTVAGRVLRRRGVRRVAADRRVRVVVRMRDGRRLIKRIRC